VAQRIRSEFGTKIAAVGIPGVNGFLNPVDMEELIVRQVC